MKQTSPRKIRKAFFPWILSIAYKKKLEFITTIKRDQNYNNIKDNKVQQKLKYVTLIRHNIDPVFLALLKIRILIILLVYRVSPNIHKYLTYRLISICRSQFNTL